MKNQQIQLKKEAKIGGKRTKKRHFQPRRSVGSDLSDVSATILLKKRV
jgi:hypothetical protein